MGRFAERHGWVAVAVTGLCAALICVGCGHGAPRATESSGQDPFDAPIIQVGGVSLTSGVLEVGVGESKSFSILYQGVSVELASCAIQDLLGNSFGDPSGGDVVCAATQGTYTAPSSVPSIGPYVSIDIGTSTAPALQVTLTVLIVDDAASDDDDNNVDSTPPTINAVSPADDATDVSATTSISITFSAAMDETTVTTNTNDSACSGTLQVSDDDFVTCVQMQSAPAADATGKIFTATPLSRFVNSTTYKTRVTTGAHGANDVAMSSTYTMSNGFLVEAMGTIFLFSTSDALGGSQMGDRATADARCYSSWATNSDHVYAKCDGTRVRAFLCYDDDAVADFPTTYSVPTYWPIKSPNETQLSSEWSTLLDGAIDSTMANAGLTISGDLYWTGCTAVGASYEHNCSDWSDLNAMGVAGVKTSSGSEWLQGNQIYTCHPGVYQYDGLCICW